MMFEVDKRAHDVYNALLRISRMRIERHASRVLCRCCDKPVTVVYHEDRLYSVQCPHCGIVTLVMADNPEHAARKATND